MYRDRWHRLTTKILAKGTRVSCSGCRRCPYKGILHSIFCRNPAEEILRTIFHCYLHKENLQGLPWHLFVMFSATLFGAYCRDIFFRVSWQAFLGAFSKALQHQVDPVAFSKAKLDFLQQVQVCLHSFSQIPEDHFGWCIAVLGPLGANVP